MTQPIHPIDVILHKRDGLTLTDAEIQSFIRAIVDRTPDKTGGPTVLSGEDPRVMEIWNNVFIQYNRNPDKSLTPLPAKHVDTGMGLERIIQVLQGKNDNYGIDLFDPFWAKLKELSGISYTGKYPKGNEADPEAEAKDAELRHDIAFRVIADHIRCLTFALTDGATVAPLLPEVDDIDEL